jgi:hypothetical protein
VKASTQEEKMGKSRSHIHELLEPDSDEHEILDRLHIETSDHLACALEGAAAFSDSDSGKIFIPELDIANCDGTIRRQCRECQDAFWIPSGQPNVEVCAECVDRLYLN